MGNNYSNSSGIRICCSRNVINLDKFVLYNFPVGFVSNFVKKENEVKISYMIKNIYQMQKPTH